MLNGDVYIADTANNCIRKCSLSTGNITTVAGNNIATFGGDNQLATSASLNAPQGVFVNSGGDIFIADTGNHRIRKVDGLTNIITTVAGTGTPGAMGDNAAASGAQLNGPTAIIGDSSGVIYIADTNNHLIRRIDTQNTITTFAGNGTATLSGDGNAATSAGLNLPAGVALDSSKNLLIADTGNHRIRKVDALTNTITTVVGTSAGFSDGNGDALQAALNSPTGVAIGASDALYIADTNNQRIRLSNSSVSIDITIDSTSAAPNPVQTTVPVTFSATATQTQGNPLTYTWDFGDNSPTAAGQTVNHAYAAEDTFTAVVSVSDGIQSVARSLSVMTLGPN